MCKRNSLICGRVLDNTAEYFNPDYAPNYAAVSYRNRERHRHARPEDCAAVRFPGAVAAKAPQSQARNDQRRYSCRFLAGIEHRRLAHAHDVPAVKLLCLKRFDVVLRHSFGSGKMEIVSGKCNFAITPRWNGRLLKAAAAVGATKTNSAHPEAVESDV